MNASRSFIHECWNVEAIRMPFSTWWMHKLGSIQAGQYSSELTRSNLSGHERHGANLNALYWGKETSLNRLQNIWFQLMTFQKWQNYGDRERSVVARGLRGGGKDDPIEHWEFRAVQYRVWCYTGGYRTPYICPNPLNKPHQGWPWCRRWDPGDEDVSRWVHQWRRMSPPSGWGTFMGWGMLWGGVFTPSQFCSELLKENKIPFLKIRLSWSEVPKLKQQKVVKTATVLCMCEMHQFYWEICSRT